MAFWDQIVIRVFSALTVVGNVLIVLYLVDLLFGKFGKGKMLGGLWKHFRVNALGYVFLVSILATGGSLIFSELLNFTPCVLCWFQRILMYPMVLLSGLALVKKDKRILFYLAALGIIGVFLSGYHYFGQINDNTTLPCSVLGLSASCSDSFFLQYGYVTIPFMAFTAFLLVVVAWHNRED